MSRGHKRWCKCPELAVKFSSPVGVGHGEEEAVKRMWMTLAWPGRHRDPAVEGPSQTEATSGEGARE